MPALAFVSIDHVVVVFELLSVYLETRFPDCLPSLTELLDSFEDTYIGRVGRNGNRRVPRFPIRMWNMYERALQSLRRTNNAVEGG